MNSNVISSADYDTIFNVTDTADGELTKVCYELLNYDEISISDVTDKDQKIINRTIEKCDRAEDGRLILPALWNESILNLLPNNYNMVEKILFSTLKKLKRNPSDLAEYDAIIKTQLNDGIIERAGELCDLKHSLNHSFLAHNAVFRRNVETTKCRIVYLSNLCERKSEGMLSHNQVSLPGPQLNSKIVMAITLLRFNKYLLLYDIVKAFHMLRLRSEDSDKMLFLWFKDLANNNFDLVAYRFLRVPFGMRFSPFLLMISLYMILVLNVSLTESEKKVCGMIYNLAYMDNLAFSSNSISEVKSSLDTAKKILGSYGFTLQQVCVNDKNLEFSINGRNSAVDETCKLFGLLWNTSGDLICCKDVKLDTVANTKRRILSTLHSIYDPLGIMLPTLNRARLFLHSLQLDSGLAWDTELDLSKQKQWKLIARQFNSGGKVTVSRNMGDYDSCYNLVTFTDASRDSYGCVVYLQHAFSKKLNFLVARNKLVKCQGEHSPSIPVLELIAMKFGLTVAFEMHKDFTSSFCPVKIQDIKVYSDATIALNWLSHKTQKFTKIERKGVLINNTLDAIVKLCNLHPVSFYHVRGGHNPADFVTRCVSYRVLRSSNYHEGPLNLSVDGITVPFSGQANKSCFSVSMDCSVSLENVVQCSKYSSFGKLCRVLHNVRIFIHKYRLKLGKTNASTLKCPNFVDTRNMIIRENQRSCYADVFQYLSSSNGKIPSVVNQLNLFLDDSNIIRVAGKFSKLDAPFEERNPILLHRDSHVNRGVIWDLHVGLRHAGVYRLLTTLRREFWIPSAFQVVKRIIKPCLICKKVNSRTLSINRNSYKDYRVNPAEFPFREIAVDHIGPFNVNIAGHNDKAYILIVTCLWSRAVNLLVCRNIDRECFLLALQTHILDFGVCQRIVGDNGSPITSSIRRLEPIFKDENVVNFLKERGIKLLTFEPYPPGASFLGGVVESLVKQVKRLFNSSVRNTCLSYDQFIYTVKECATLINKRPVAYQALLVDPLTDNSVDVITPEMLIKGRDIPCISIIETNVNSEDPDYELPDLSKEQLFKRFIKLRKIQERLAKLYYSQFLQNLRGLASAKPDLYKRKNYVPLNKNDLVAIHQSLSKPHAYPLGIVISTEFNDLGEVVSAQIRKSNGEIVRRHTSDIILLESCDTRGLVENNCPKVSTKSQLEIKPVRQAAETSSQIIKDLISRNLI